MEIEDDYEHPSDSSAGCGHLVYVPTNVPGKDCPDEFFQQLDTECYCGDSCLTPDCPCSRFSSGGSLVECSRRCGCDPRTCDNRTLQAGPVKGLYTRETQKGLGLFCKDILAKGTHVTTYSGEVISIEAGLARNEIDGEAHMKNYIIFISELGHGFRLDFAIDPTICGK